MRLRFWRSGKKVGQTPAPGADIPVTPAKPPQPKDIDCRYCGPVHADPEEHLASTEHRLAQAMAIAPGVIEEG